MRRPRGRTWQNVQTKSLCRTSLLSSSHRCKYLILRISCLILRLSNWPLNYFFHIFSHGRIRSKETCVQTISQWIHSHESHLPNDTPKQSGAWALKKSLLQGLCLFCIFEKSGIIEATDSDLVVSQLWGSIISAHVPGQHMWASAGNIKARSSALTDSVPRKMAKGRQRFQHSSGIELALCMSPGSLQGGGLPQLLNSLWRDCQMTGRGSNLDWNLNSATWPICCKGFISSEITA